jgi:hypothetical protein
MKVYFLRRHLTVKPIPSSAAGPLVLYDGCEFRSTSVSAGMKSNAPKLSGRLILTTPKLDFLLLIV